MTCHNPFEDLHDRDHWTDGELRTVRRSWVMWREASTNTLYHYDLPGPMTRQHRLTTRECSRAKARAYVRTLHRHLPKPPPGDLVRFEVVDEDGHTRGVAIVGRPSARMLDTGNVAEVTRVATDGSPNACSALYGAAARWARAQSLDSIITYTLASEPGTSLRAAGWELDAEDCGGGHWSDSRSRTERHGELAATKQRWRKTFTFPSTEAA